MEKSPQFLYNIGQSSFLLSFKKLLLSLEQRDELVNFNALSLIIKWLDF